MASPRRARVARAARRLEKALSAPPPVACSPEQEAALREAWAQLPEIECAGLCWDSCGPIRMTGPEHALTERAGTHVPDSTFRQGPMVCPALTMFRQCSVYENRPTICRLWGLVESMPCNYGCRPVGGLISDKAGFSVLARVYEIAGDGDEAAGLRQMFDGDERAAATSRAMRETVRSAAYEAMARRRRAEADGTAIYVDGPGRLRAGDRPGSGR